MTKVVHVAVGVIRREQQYFLTKRLVNAHQGGKWEFPGGKVESDETVAQALYRELKEEIAIDVLSCQPLIEISHDYGGKVESDETVAQALYRELKEEIAIDVLSCQPLIEISHDYGDKKVLLEVYLVENFQQEPIAQEGQQSNWFSLAQLKELDFPDANKAIIDKLEEK